MGHLPLKEIIMITFLKHERPFRVRGDKKVSRKQKTGPEWPPLKTLKRWPSQEYQSNLPGELASECLDLVQL